MCNGEVYCNKCPKLLVTTPIGKESWGEIEVGNSIFPEDPDVNVFKTVFPGVLLVYSSALEPFHTYRLVLSSEPAFLTRVVPILDCVNTHAPEDLVSRINTIIDVFARSSKELSIEIVLRGSTIKEKELRKLVFDIFRRRGIRFVKEADKVLKIESVCDCYFFSIIQRGSDRIRKQF